MPTGTAGTCRLCLTPKVELRDSHFVPRSFYKLFHQRGLPVTSSPTVSPKTDDVNLHGTLNMLKNSRRVGKLAKSDQAIISDGKITR